jgi:hypothetical protein
VRDGLAETACHRGLEQEWYLADNRRLGAARHQHGEIVLFDMRDQRVFAGLGEGGREVDQFGTSLCLNFDLSR